MNRIVPRTVLCAMHETAQQLREQDFTEPYIQAYRHIWDRFARYASSRGRRYFSASLAREYVKSATKPGGMLHPAARQSIRRAMRVLQEHVAHGRHRRNPPRPSSGDLPPFMAKELAQFVGYARTEVAWSHSTIRNRTADVGRFLNYLWHHGVKDWRDLTASRILAYLGTLSTHAVNTRVATANAIRQFCRVMFIRGVLPMALYDELPPIRQERGRRLMVLWTTEELRRVLAAVDRRTRTGKRDYAILLLAARLGLRVSDIRNLHLADIHWDQSFIEFVQQKTKVALRLPIPDEVGDALADYLRHGRPATSRREVFLTRVAPHEPLGRHNNLHHLPQQYRKKAGLPPRRWCGLHSLRHTLATQLLEAGIGPESIAGVLGHQSLETTDVYLRVSVEALRQAGLDPEEEVGHV